MRMENVSAHLYEGVVVEVVFQVEAELVPMSHGG